MCSTQYIYLLQEREFTKTNENIYKIGKTKQENCKRFKDYPKGSILIIQVICENCDTIEKELIHLFKQQFMQRIDIGTEYFQGDPSRMRKVIFDYIMSLESKEIEKQKENNKIITSFSIWIFLFCIYINCLFVVMKYY